MRLPYGRFDRDSLGRTLRWVCPAAAVETILSLDPEELAASGKRLVLMDADNTLLPWKSREIPVSTREWIERAKSAGLQLCLVSNTRDRERLEWLSHEIDVPIAEGKFKPSRQMFLDAMARFSAGPEETLMIGDQLFTDIFGANRVAIDTVLVHPMSRREFVGTRFTRIAERLIRPILAQASNGDDDLPVLGRRGIFAHRVVRQFAKFCIVGGTSFVIDYCVRMTLLFGIIVDGRAWSIGAGDGLRAAMPSLFAFAQDGKDAFFPIAAACGAAFGMLNSFLLNRSWTFRARGADKTTAQVQRFLTISLIGLGLNVVLSTLFNQLIPGDPKNSARIATVLAAACVAFWNFFGQRLYAFRSSNPSA